MFDFIHEHMEKDAAWKATKAAHTAKYYRNIGFIHYSFTLVTSLFAYATLLISFLFADKYQKYSTEIMGGAVIFCAIVLLLSTYLKRDSLFLNVLIGIVSKTNSKINKVKMDNLFFSHLVALLLFIYLPLFIIAVSVLTPGTTWISTSSATFKIYIDPLRQIMAFTAVIIAAQVALFTFMFAQLLGKYSSKIAGALYRHPAILLLWSYPIISLIIFYIFFIYGLPNNINFIIAPFFTLLNVICLIITISVANVGTHTDKVIIYAGRVFSRTVRRKVKRAIPQSSSGVRYVWLILDYLGLDWRDQDRTILFSPPIKGMSVTASYLASLFNAANKAFQESQQENFASSLISIRKVIDAYIQKRSSYFGTTDTVISYTNDCMASLLRVSSNSPNEYLITAVVRSIGDLAVLSLQIDPLPRKNEPSREERILPRNHRLASSWMWLLREGFELSHNLMRSTAANETISQLERVASFAFYRDYGDVINVGYLSNIEQIHSICLTKPDAYHLTLAGDCIRKSMRVLAIVAQKYGQWSSQFNLNEQMLNTIEGMASKQFMLEKLPSFNFSDATTILTSKIDLADFIIQDIFKIILMRNFEKQWEQREAVNDLIRIIRLLTNLSIAALKNKIASASNFIEALYEIGYLTLRDLPKQYNPPDVSQKNRGGALYPTRPSSNQKILEEELFKAWIQLFPVFFNEEHHISDGWKQAFFGIVGIGMAVYCEKKSEALKHHLMGITKEYLNICMKENTKRKHGIPEWAWDYLQLCGAWIYHFLKEEDFARTIAKEVAQGRPFKHSIGGLLGSSHGRYGTYGYPEGMLFSDFFLPWLRNLQPQQYLSEEEWETFRRWQENLMDDAVLISYYEIVEKTRKPLRKAFHKKVQASTKKHEI